MQVRKFQADGLFDGCTVLYEELVLVTEESGKVLDILPTGEAGENVEKEEGILSPGFINCHCHLELSHMKGMIPEESGMTDFILSVLKQRHLAEEVIIASMEAAETEMLKNGIVAVGDICNNTLSLGPKQKGRLYYHNFIEASGFAPTVAEERFKRAVDIYEAFSAGSQGSTWSSSIVPHAPYSVSTELFERLKNFPGNRLFSMHNQESVEEEQFFTTKQGGFLRLYEQLNTDISFFNRSGKTSLQTVLPWFNEEDVLILVHNVTTGREDIESLHRSNVPDQSIYFCLCPNANIYIGGRLPDIPLLQASGFGLVIGTDSLASNHQLSILEELRRIHTNFPHIPLNDLLTWATSNGARALRIDHLLGSFEKGKKPGVLLLASDLSRVRRLL